MVALAKDVLALSRIAVTATSREFHQQSFTRGNDLLTLGFQRLAAGKANHAGSTIGAAVSAPSRVIDSVK